jgi:hypothetical protein
MSRVLWAGLGGILLGIAFSVLWVTAPLKDEPEPSPTPIPVYRPDVIDPSSMNGFHFAVFQPGDEGRRHRFEERFNTPEGFPPLCPLMDLPTKPCIRFSTVTDSGFYILIWWGDLYPEEEPQ